MADAVRVIHPYYQSVPRLGGITPLNDQIAAGVIMWVPGSLFFLVPGAVIMFNLLSSQSVVAPPVRRPSGGPSRQESRAVR